MRLTDVTDSESDHSSMKAQNMLHCIFNIIEQPSEGYDYTVGEIAWSADAAHLPEVATINLPESLVLLAEEDFPDGIDSDQVWDDAIIDALTEKFGVRPIEIGGFGPAEDWVDDEDDEEDED